MTTAPLSAVARYVRHIAERDTRGQGDRQLLDRFTHRRDEAAFTELVRRHGPMVLAVCRRVLHHAQDAEDAFQAAFLVLARKAAAVRQRDAVGAWLYQVAYRIALRARAAGDRRRQRLTGFSDALPAPDPELPGGDLRTALDEEVHRLPEPFRAAVVLCYLEGRTQTEAARLLATTATAVNSRLRRARDILRQRLVRRGLALSGAAVAAALSAAAAEAADGAVSDALTSLTARTALDFAANRAPVCAASALAKGALQSMTTSKLKILSVLALLATLLATAALLLPGPALGDDVKDKGGGKPPRPTTGDDPTPRPGKAKGLKSCIVLWMAGGPSQFETFDMKPGTVNGGLFRPIKTTAKGVEISEHLPKLARFGNHLAVIRSLTHNDGDHGRGTYLMHTGHAPDDGIDYPSLGAVIGKELGDTRTGLPRYLSLLPMRFFSPRAFGGGFLGPKYGPVVVGENRLVANVKADEALRLLPAADFDIQAKGKGDQLRKAVMNAFDLDREKPAARDAYGRNTFGQGCLLARRLVEAGVPVVEVAMGGWDTHQNGFELLKKQSAVLDGAWSSLLKDLQDRRLLDSTLIVWMGEFGRTPRINAGNGRDHWPRSFSVVLAGCGIKGGQAIGKTSDDGTQITERPVTPQQLFATIYQALGIDATRQNMSNTGRPVRLVDTGTQPVKEALR